MRKKCISQVEMVSSNITRLIELRKQLYTYRSLHERLSTLQNFYLRGVFSGFSGFPPSSKINIAKFQFDRGFEGHGFVSRRLLCATLVKQSQFILSIIYLQVFF